jgi:hypothetical protein
MITQSNLKYIQKWMKSCLFLQFFKIQNTYYDIYKIHAFVLSIFSRGELNKLNNFQVSKSV